MSSLLQFSGRTGERGVELQFVLREPHGYTTRGLDTFTCPTCGREHDHIYLAWRKPVGTYGQWVVFEYLGEEHLPDLSIPIEVSRKPYRARRADVDESVRIWHSG